MSAPGTLDELAERLTRVAAELRDGDLSAERAAALVEECARLASEASGRLDRQVRADDGHGAPGQLPLGR